MNNLKNKVTLIGYLGKDAEIKILESGRKMARVSIATTDSYKDNKGERIFETTWSSLVMWGKTAEFAEKFLRKGSEVAVEGRLSSRTWEDNLGKKHYVTEVVVHEVLMLNGQKEKIAA